MVVDGVITVASDSSWHALRSRNATSVIDPMVVRVADLFSRGHSGGNAETWNIIESNIEDLATFVDALILEPGIPVFDYWYSGEGWGGNPDFFEYTKPVVLPVGVKSDVWSPIAEDSWRTFHDKPRLPAAAAAEIGAKLRDMGWDFIPREFGQVDVSKAQGSGDKSGDDLVNSYLYVALLFAGYAAKLGDDHQPGAQILSPGQSRMFVATAAAERSGAARPLSESAIFGEIEDIINESRPGYPRTWRSDRLYFLPYLLTMEDGHGHKKIRTPEQLFREAISLRGRSDVLDYRERLHRAEARLQGTGEDDANWKLELQRAKLAVQEALKVTPSVATLDVKVGFPPNVGVSVPVNVSPLRDWLLGAWPGKRYRRVLTRLVAAQAAVKQIQNGLERIWRAA